MLLKYFQSASKKCGTQFIFKVFYFSCILDYSNTPGPSWKILFMLEKGKPHMVPYKFCQDLIPVSRGTRPRKPASDMDVWVFLCLHVIWVNNNNTYNK